MSERGPAPDVWREAVRRLEPHALKLRFLAVGAFNTAFGVAIFPLLMWGLGRFGLHYMAVLVISQGVGTLVGFTTQKTFVFRTRGNYLAEFARFSTYYVGTYVVNWLVLPVLVEGFHVNPMLAQPVFVVFVVFTSYFWHSRFTFGARGADK